MLNVRSNVQVLLPPQGARVRRDEGSFFGSSFSEFITIQLGNFYCDCGSGAGCKFVAASAAPLIPPSVLLWGPSAPVQPVAPPAPASVASVGPIDPAKFPEARCPSAHPLTAVTGRDPVRCDQCGTDGLVHSLSCVECDYETCEPCLLKAFAPPVIAAIPTVAPSGPTCFSGHALTPMTRDARCDECGAAIQESLCCKACDYDRCAPACKWTKPERKVGKDGRDWYSYSCLPFLTQ